MRTPGWKLPGTLLTVVIRDDGPMIFCGDSPTYRSVQLALTTEQLEQLRLRLIGRSGKACHYESVSKAFIEPIPVSEEPGEETP